VMARFFVLIFVAALLGCSDESSDISAKEKVEIDEAIKEVMCRDNNRSYAFSEIVELAEENPKAAISIQVFDAAKNVDEAGCRAIIAQKRDEWGKSDARIQTRQETFQKMKREGRFDHALEKARELKQ
jgi:benzoyl-CoA reductase/2-hydroxyglutaryl-CoA dehydratase subunit BcrC/BadD/HgdB